MSGIESPYGSGFIEDLVAAPIRDGYRSLECVSGYASPAMIKRFFEIAADQDARVELDLTIGMTVKDGIPRDSHEKFKDLVVEHGRALAVRYVHEPPAAHYKVYRWSGHPTQADRVSCGSANFTLQGLCSAPHQQESMAAFDPGKAARDIESAWSRSVKCTAPDLKRIRLTERQSWEWDGTDETVTGQAGQALDPNDYPEEQRLREATRDETRFGRVLVNDRGNPVVLLSLLRKDATETHGGDGINWGHGRGRKRDANEACLAIRKGRRRKDDSAPVMSLDDFFVRVGETIVTIPFNLTFDDGATFTVQREQSRGKAISVVKDKSALGLYLRNRIGVTSGDFVRKADLVAYGRSHVLIERLPSGAYLADFSPLKR